MKLKNKKTGEIVETAIVDHGAEWEIRNMYTDEDTQTYNSLAELNEEWEDYEGQKEWYWFIEDNGVIQRSCHYEDLHPTLDKARKDIGNYFETKEEAERAVECLRAWKRLKDKGFRFIEGYLDNNDDFIIKAKLGHVGLIDQPDVSLLFGGEE